MKCRFCGKSFKTKDTRRKYCSPECSKKGKKEEIKKYYQEYYQRPEIKARTREYHKKYYQLNHKRIKKKRREYSRKPEVKERVRKRKENRILPSIQLCGKNISFKNIMKNVNILEKNLK